MNVNFQSNIVLKGVVFLLATISIVVFATGQGCPPPPPPADPVCGNGIVEVGEQCDPPDGTTCDGSCQNISTPPAVCGNDIVEAGEQCDPPDGTTCDASCQKMCRYGIWNAGLPRGVRFTVNYKLDGEQKEEVVNFGIGDLGKKSVAVPADASEIWVKAEAKKLISGYNDIFRYPVSGTIDQCEIICWKVAGEYYNPNHSKMDTCDF